MSRSVYMPTRSYSSNDLVKTAQARGLADRFIEATYFGGRRLESKSTVFGTMMNELRNIDNKIRATLLNKTISKQTPYPNENMGSAEELLKNAQSAYDSKEYLLAISYLEQFYVKVLYCAQLLKNLDSIVAELNKEYYKSLLEPLKEDQIERIKKFLKDKKEAEYLPEDTRKDIEEGKANIEGKLKATTSARYRLNKKAGFYKQAGLISWVQGLFNPREAALTLWERIQPGASKDLKRDIGRVLSASNRLFNVFKNSLETMSSARANREIAKYQTAAKTIPAQVNSYSQLIDEADFNKYTQQLNEVLASIATPQQAAKVRENQSPSSGGLAAQVASGNTSSPVGAPVVYSLGSGKDINDFKQGQQVYVMKDGARISATVNSVDKTNKVSVNIDGFPGPILLNPNQVFINDAAIVAQNLLNAGAVNIPADASDPAVAAAVIQQAGNAVAGDINNAAVEPPQAPPEPVNPNNPTGTPPTGDDGGAAAPAGDTPPDAGGAGDAPAGGTPADAGGASDAPAGSAPADAVDAGSAGGGAGDGGEISAGAGKADDKKTIKIKPNAFTKEKIIIIKKNNKEYDSTKTFPDDIQPIIDEAISFLKNLSTGQYIELSLGLKNKKTEGNYTIIARLGTVGPGIFVQLNKDNKANTAENYEINFALEPSDEFGKPDPKSNEQTVDVDDEAGMKVEPKDLDPNNTYEVFFTIDQFIKNCQYLNRNDIKTVEFKYYADILKDNFKILRYIKISNKAGNNIINGLHEAKIELIKINFTDEVCELMCNIPDAAKSYNDQTREMEGLDSPEDKTLISKIPFTEVEFYKILTTSSSFTYALQALSNESPIIVASFIRRYANLIQNKNKKLSNNLHKIASRIK